MPSDFVCANGADNWIERFCYWQGQSGKRYLFTKVNLEDLPNFANCLLLLAHGSETNESHLHWIGNIEDFTPQAFVDLSDQQFGALAAYIHLLAYSETERQDIIMDLANHSGMQNWTLSA